MAKQPKYPLLRVASELFPFPRAPVPTIFLTPSSGGRVSPIMISVIAKPPKTLNKGAVTKTIASKASTKASGKADSKLSKAIEKSPDKTSDKSVEKTPAVRKEVMPAKPSRETAPIIATLEDVLARSGARDRTNVEK